MKDTNRIVVQGAAGKLCLGLTHLFTKGPLRRFNARDRAPGKRFESTENYVADRVSNVSDYQKLFSQFTSFREKTVLELGCSNGYLLDAFLQNEKFKAFGADISPKVLDIGRKLYGNRIEFIQTTATSIPLPDQSVDLIYTVDTVEHLSRPDEIFRDAYRVLKPGGEFLIYFAPWYGPCGSHLDDIIPFPWPQVVFSMDTLLKVAAHIYESKDHQHACYWFDEKTGNLRPNPYLDREFWREFLNDLTIRKFRRMLRRLPYETIHFKRIGFGGKAFRAARLLSGLAQVPLVDELFIKAVFCVLRKPAAAARARASSAVA
jgi:SAM-dependent methyltransferase